MERSDPDTAQRTRRAAQLIPAFSRILDIGDGDPALEAALPDGCLYRSCALEGLPGEAPADIVTLVGLLEGLPDPRQTLHALRALDRPLICDYPVIDRGAGYDFTPLQALMRAAGFRLRCHVRIDAARAMFKWVPDDGLAIDPPRPPKVLVLSYLNFKNFGDRLGYVVANSLLPAGTIVTHGALNSWTDTGLAYDLVIWARATA